MENFKDVVSTKADEAENMQDKLAEINNERSLFREHFLRLGYTEHEALPLTPPESDQTVSFIGSPINAFKGYLENRSDIEVPASILQPCIRTHDIVNGYDLSKIPFGMPFFHIYGTFSPRGTYEKTAADVIGYFRDAHKIANDDILIKPTIPGLSDILLAPFVAIGVKVEIDYSRYYEWRYGIDGVSGRGVTIFIRHKNGEWWDVGNVVSISDTSGQEIAVEFGVGSEFFQTALHGYNDPFDASHLSKIVKPENPVHKKVLTYLETALVASGTLAVNRTRTIRMSNRYINVALYLCEVYGYTRQEVENIANTYKNIASTHIDVDLFLEKYDARANVLNGLGGVFIDFLQNPIHTDANYMRNQLRKYLKKNGIRNEEVVLYVEKNYKNNVEIQSLCKNL